MTSRWLLVPLLLVIARAPAAGPQVSAQEDRIGPQPKRPALSIKATPMISFAPSKIRFVAELKGGSNDYEDLYCPTVEWDWNDDTTSESTADCEPYRAGTSQIPRRFTIVHEYKMSGNYRVRIRLKKKTRVIISADVLVQVYPGVSDPGRSAADPFQDPPR